MRITVTPMSRPQDAFTLTDGTDLNAWVQGGMSLGLEQNGLDGWHEGVEPRYEAPAVPNGDGLYAPDVVHLSERIVTIRGFARAWQWGQGSSLDIANFDDLLASLVGEDIEVRVEDAAGVRTVEGFLSSIPFRERVGEWAEKFSLIVSCPDPLKYGRVARFTPEGGVVTVNNPGTGSVWPRVVTTGRTRSLSLSFGGREVRWSGDAEGGLTLDFRTAIPLAADGTESGLLSYGQVFRIPPGSHDLTVSSNVPVVVEVTPGWK